MLTNDALPELNQRLDALQAQAQDRLAAKVRAHCRRMGNCISVIRLIPMCLRWFLPLVQGFREQQTSCQRFLNLRYDGTDVPLMTPAPLDGDYAAAFEQAYQVCVLACMPAAAAVPRIAASGCMFRGTASSPPGPACHRRSTPTRPSTRLPQREFGFRLEGRAVLVDDLRVRACGRHAEVQGSAEEPAGAGEGSSAASDTLMVPEPVLRRTAAFGPRFWTVLQAPSLPPQPLPRPTLSGADGRRRPPIACPT